MKKDLKKIIEHFGVNNQLKKLNEESYELIEAVRDYEEQKRVCENVGCERIHVEKCRKHIIEELADLQVVSEQIIEYYNIEHKEILDIAIKKVERTLERMESNYYKKGE